MRRLWAPDFDAMASPINAIAGEHATLEDDVLSFPLAQRCIFVNPVCMLAKAAMLRCYQM